jgi:hypothetical protein
MLHRPYAWNKPDATLLTGRDPSFVLFSGEGWETTNANRRDLGLFFRCRENMAEIPDLPAIPKPVTSVLGYAA